MRWEVVTERGFFKCNEAVRLLRDHDGVRAGTLAHIAHPLGEILGDNSGRRYTLIMVEVPIPRGLSGIREGLPEIVIFSVPEDILERVDV